MWCDLLWLLEPSHHYWWLDHITIVTRNDPVCVDGRWMCWVLCATQSARLLKLAALVHFKLTWKLVLKYIKFESKVRSGSTITISLIHVCLHLLTDVTIWSNFWIIWLYHILKMCLIILFDHLCICVTIN